MTLLGGVYFFHLETRCLHRKCQQQKIYIYTTKSLQYIIVLKIKIVSRKSDELSGSEASQENACL